MSLFSFFSILFRKRGQEDNFIRSAAPMSAGLSLQDDKFSDQLKGLAGLTRASILPTLLRKDIFWYVVGAITAAALFFFEDVDYRDLSL
jgi:hypothetical protein